MKTGMNLLSKDDFIMRPEIKFQAPRVMNGWSSQNVAKPILPDKPLQLGQVVLIALPRAMPSRGLVA